MAKTKIDAALAEAEREHEGDPERADLLRRTRRFKASWIELAEALTESRRRGDFRRWGYESFEDYTRRELYLRQETVDKLTGSGVVSAAGNRRAFRAAQEPLDLFRRYMAVYAREQAQCHFSPALIGNLEKHWNAANRRQE